MIGMIHTVPELQGDLGTPISHTYGLGVPITPVNGFGARRWNGYESLSGLGLSDDELEAMAQKLATEAGVSSGSIAGLMIPMSKDERVAFAAKLIAAGVPGDIVAAGQRQAAWEAFKQKPISKFWAVAGTISMAASAYHGYKRNDSVGWAIGWGLLGALFPIITPTIAIAQGFAKPK